MKKIIKRLDDWCEDSGFYGVFFMIFGLMWILSAFGIIMIVKAVETKNIYSIIFASLFSITGFVMAYLIEKNSKS